MENVYHLFRETQQDGEREGSAKKTRGGKEGEGCEMRESVYVNGASSFWQPKGAQFRGGEPEKTTSEGKYGGSPSSKKKVSEKP